MSDDERTELQHSPAGPVAGERLAEARRLRQISLPDIARELHLDETKVQALEENRFDMLGAPVFAKGHLRKYAEVVGVPIDDVMADYYTLSRTARTMPVVGRPRSKPPREIRPGPWLVALLLLGAAAAAGWWWLDRAPAMLAPSTPPPDAGNTGNAARSPASGRQETTDGVPAAETPPAESPPAQPAADAAGLPAAPLAAAEAVAENAAPGGGAELTLALSFSGDCWTEVTDGDGERLFFDLGSSGRNVTVRGTPPLRVLLGDSANVSLRVDGEPYAIAAADRRGDTARLTINRP